MICLKIIYDVASFKKAFTFFIIPLLVILVTFLVGLTIYSIKSKKKDTRYNYNMNFYSLLLGIIVCSFLTAFATGFSINFIEIIKSSNSIDEFKLLYYLSFLFPLFPLIFLIIFMVLFYKNYKKKKHKYRTDDVLQLYDTKNKKKDDIEVI